MKIYGYLRYASSLVSSRSYPMIDILGSPKKNLTVSRFFHSWLKNYDNLNLNNFYHLWVQTHIADTIDQAVSIFWSILERESKKYYTNNPIPSEIFLENELLTYLQSILQEAIKTIDFSLYKNSPSELKTFINSRLKDANKKKKDLKDYEKIEYFFQRGLNIPISSSTLTISRTIRNNYSHGNINFEDSENTSLDFHNAIYSIRAEVSRMLIKLLELENTNYYMDVMNKDNTHLVTQKFDVCTPPTVAYSNIFIKYNDL